MSRWGSMRPFQLNS